MVGNEFRPVFQVVVRQKAAFVRRMLELLSCEDGEVLVRIQGELGGCGFDSADVVSCRLGGGDGLDEVVVRLGPESVERVMAGILRAGLRKVIHLEGSMNGAIAWAAYDNLHEDCVAVGGLVGAEVMQQLVEQEVIWSYRRVVIAS